MNSGDHSARVPAVTIVVVPRERFSDSQRSLLSIFERTTAPFEMIYVDGGSPPAMQSYLCEQAEQRKFLLLRSDAYLTPNEARNLALRYVRTPYVVFVDNDVIVSLGWLSALLRCAQETGAWVVGPLYCEGDEEEKTVHMAGGELRLADENGRPTFYEHQRFQKQPLSEVRRQLRREPTELIEFHCALVDMRAFADLGPLDEGLLSCAEHCDLCLAVRQAGKQVYFEPESVITHITPERLDPADQPFFELRWCDAWNKESLRRFAAKWDLDPADAGLRKLHDWLDYHRRLGIGVARLRRVLRGTLYRLLLRRVIAPLETLRNRWKHPHAECARNRTPAARIVSPGRQPLSAATPGKTELKAARAA